MFYFLTDVDSKCQWNAIPWLNQYQGTFRRMILHKDFNSTLLRNEVSGRYSTTLQEMHVKKSMIEKAESLLKDLRRS